MALAWSRGLSGLIPRIADEASQSILDETRESDDRLQRAPDGIAKFVEYATFLLACPELHDKLSRRWEKSEELYELMSEFAIEPSDGSMANSPSRSCISSDSSHRRSSASCSLGAPCRKSA